MSKLWDSETRPTDRSFVITNNNKLKMETYFAAPWMDTSNAHTSTYATQLDRRQLKCVNFDVFISDATKIIILSA